MKSDPNSGMQVSDGGKSDASVLDVARYVLDKVAPKEPKKALTAWKLQKLVYYCQAWSLVWDEEKLFDERIEAWADGPVSPALYDAHKGKFWLEPSDVLGDPSVLSEEAVETIDAVLDHYSGRTGRYLRDLTHMERPWKDARGNTPPGDRSNAQITCESMVDYYGCL